MILFLSFADARFITGETIKVGGGFMYKLHHTLVSGTPAYWMTTV